MSGKPKYRKSGYKGIKKTISKRKRRGLKKLKRWGKTRTDSMNRKLR